MLQKIICPKLLMERRFLLFSISRTLFIIAMDIIKIFVALHFYELYDNSLTIAIGAYVSVHLGYALALPWAAKYVSMLDTKKSLIVGASAMILSNIPIFFLEQNNYLLIFWILLFIVAHLFYYIPYFIFVSKFTNSKQRGSQMGKLIAFAILASAISPLIAGYVSSIWGLHGIVLTAMLVTLASFILLIFIPTYRYSYTGKIFKLFKFKKLKKLYFLHSANGAQSNLNHFWHIFLFIFFGASYAKLGLFFTGIILFSAFMSLLFGQFLDHHNRKQIINYEAFLNTLGWSLRILAISLPTVVIADAIYKVNKYIKDEAVSVIDIDILNHKGQDEILDEKIVMRECVINFSIGVALILGIIIANNFGLKAAMLIAVVLSFYFTKALK